jgi:hypothetical protein
MPAQEAVRIGTRRRVMIDVVERGGSTFLINCRALDVRCPPMLLLIGARDVAGMSSRPKVSQVRVLEYVADCCWSLVDGMESR